MNKIIAFKMRLLGRDRQVIPPPASSGSSSGGDLWCQPAVAH